jgi:hypothetical protein
MSREARKCQRHFLALNEVLYTETQEQMATKANGLSMMMKRTIKTKEMMIGNHFVNILKWRKVNAICNKFYAPVELVQLGEREDGGADGG